MLRSQQRNLRAGTLSGETPRMLTEELKNYSARALDECWSEATYGSGIRIHRLERLHDQSALPGVGVDLVVLQGNAHIAEHVHENAQVLMHILDGSGVVDLNGVPHELSTGTVVTMDRNVRHAIRANAGGLRFISVQTPPIYDVSNNKDTCFV